MSVTPTLPRPADEPNREQKLLMARESVESKSRNVPELLGAASFLLREVDRLAWELREARKL